MLATNNEHTITHITHQIISIVKRYDSKAEVYLYGSRAKGTDHKESDWDVLILLNKANATPEIEDKITNALYDLEIETGEVISPGIYTQHEWYNKYKVTPYYQNVMREGLLI